MLSLLRMIPSRAEWLSMTDEQKDLLALGMNTDLESEHLPVDGVNYHHAEKVAIMSAKNAYILDLIAELDLEVDYDE